MILGFTGTRQGLTGAQLAGLPLALPIPPDHLLHGGAQGADTQFDRWFRANWGAMTLHIEVYPSYGRHWNGDDSSCLLTVHPPMQPLARNVIIAKRCDRLLACPAEMNEVVRSGTWATVRYARNWEKPITLLMPDGTIRREPAPAGSVRGVAGRPRE